MTSVEIKQEMNETMQQIQILHTTVIWPCGCHIAPMCGFYTLPASILLP